MSRVIVPNKLGRCRLCMMLSYTLTLLSAIIVLVSFTLNPELLLIPSSIAMGFFATFSIAHTAAYIYRRIKPAGRKSH